MRTQERKVKWLAKHNAVKECSSWHSNLCNLAPNFFCLSTILYFSVKMLVTQIVEQPWGSTNCNPMDCSLPGSSVHGILQGRILEWVAIPISRGFSLPRDQAWVSRIVGRFFTIWTIRDYLFTIRWKKEKHVSCSQEK